MLLLIGTSVDFSGSCDMFRGNLLILLLISNVGTSAVVVGRFLFTSYSFFIQSRQEGMICGSNNGQME